MKKYKTIDLYKREIREKEKTKKVEKWDLKKVKIGKIKISKNSCYQ